MRIPLSPPLLPSSPPLPPHPPNMIHVPTTMTNVSLCYSPAEIHELGQLVTKIGPNAIPGEAYEFAEGEFAIRKGKLCTILKIHWNEVPPYFEVKACYGGDQTVGTEAGKLKALAPVQQGQVRAKMRSIDQLTTKAKVAEGGRVDAKRGLETYHARLVQTFERLQAMAEAGGSEGGGGSGGVNNEGASEGGMNNAGRFGPGPPLLAGPGAHMGGAVPLERTRGYDATIPLPKWVPGAAPPGMPSLNIIGKWMPSAAVQEEEPSPEDATPVHITPRGGASPSYPSAYVSRETLGGAVSPAPSTTPPPSAYPSAHVSREAAGGSVPTSEHPPFVERRGDPSSAPPGMPSFDQMRRSQQEQSQQEQEQRDRENQREEQDRQQRAAASVYPSAHVSRETVGGSTPSAGAPAPSGGASYPNVAGRASSKEHMGGAGHAGSQETTPRQERSPGSGMGSGMGAPGPDGGGKVPARGPSLGGLPTMQRMATQEEK